MMNIQDGATTGHGALSGRSIAELRRTRKWAKFLAWVGLIFAGLMGLFVVLATTRISTGEAVMVLPMIIVTTAFVLPPSLFLLSYYRGLGAFLSGDSAAAVTAFRAQKRFWQFVTVVVGLTLLLTFLQAALSAVGINVMTPQPVVQEPTRGP